MIIHVLRSLKLDAHWISTPGIPGKWAFLLKKYELLLFPFLFKTQENVYAINLWGRKLLLPSYSHIGLLQSNFPDHMALREYVSKNPIVVDVGAHVGEFAMFAEIVLNAKQIYSFEPVKKSFELLSHNTSNTNYNVAIGNSSSLELFVPEQTGMSSQSKTTEPYYKERVSCTSLDAIQAIQSIHTIDLLKIDVEGMEYDVISASPKTIKKSSYITIEAALQRPGTKNAVDTIELLKEICPSIQLIHIGHIHRYSDTGIQAAVDFIFHNPQS